LLALLGAHHFLHVSRIRVKEVLLACKNFYFLKTHVSGCTGDATHFTSMATGQNRFSVLAEQGSSLPYKSAAPVSPREAYPELPDLSDNRLPSSKSTTCFKIVERRIGLRKDMQLLVKYFFFLECKTT